MDNQEKCRVLFWDAIYVLCKVCTMGNIDSQRFLYRSDQVAYDKVFPKVICGLG